MNFAIPTPRGFAAAGRASGLSLLIWLTACGGGGSADTGPAADCNPADPATAAECGSVILALTDADGDFLNYTVDVLSVTLETANGRVVETLPRTTRINFADYVDLSEIMTVATVPPATYVAGTIRLDYSDAEVFVEAGGTSRDTVVTDLDGNPLTQTELRVVLSDRDRLVVTPGRPAFLQFDFDLAASHEVDTAPTPAVAASTQFIVAETSPVDEKPIRVRGPLIEVNEDASEYVVDVRPFHDRTGDFGRFTVHTSADTEFEVDGNAYVGAEGLRALAAAGPGTPTIAAGTLDLGDRAFTASIVLAGSSVPGTDRPAIVGNVIARDGNFLTVRGATVIPSDRRPHFHDDVAVEIGPDTKVFRDGHGRDDEGIRAISIGQRVTIFGNRSDAMPAVTDAASPQILFDATQGAVRMHVTHVSGVVNAVVPGQTDIRLYAIDRRRADVYDFTGTGPTPADDADPANYEVSTGDLTLADFAAGKPVVARGFPEAFGTAPPDFHGRTVIDYSDVRSSLGAGWGSEGTIAPFLQMNPDGLLFDNGNPDIGERHHVKQGPVLIDLTELDSDTLIVPRPTGRKLYVIATADSLRQYADFGDFVEDLSTSLDGATTARSMYARGHYDSAANTFTAWKMGIYLLEP